MLQKIELYSVSFTPSISQEAQERSSRKHSFLCQKSGRFAHEPDLLQFSVKSSKMSERISPTKKERKGRREGEDERKKLLSSKEHKGNYRRGEGQRG
jgi:hypothetical protein